MLIELTNARRLNNPGPATKVWINPAHIVLMELTDEGSGFEARTTLKLVPDGKTVSVAESPETILGLCNVPAR